MTKTAWNQYKTYGILVSVPTVFFFLNYLKLLINISEQILKKTEFLSTLLKFFFSRPISSSSVFLSVDYVIRTWHFIVALPIYLISSFN